METNIYYSKINAFITLILSAGILIFGLIKIFKDKIIEGYASEIIILSLIGLALCYMIYKSFKYLLYSQPVIIFTEKGLIIKNHLYKWSIIENISITKGFMARITIHYNQNGKKRTMIYNMNDLEISRKAFIDRLKQYYD